MKKLLLSISLLVCFTRAFAANPSFLDLGIDKPNMVYTNGIGITMGDLEIAGPSRIVASYLALASQVGGTNIVGVNIATGTLYPIPLLTLVGVTNYNMARGILYSNVTTGAYMVTDTNLNQAWTNGTQWRVISNGTFRGSDFNLSAAQEVHVSKDGNDSTGLRSRLDLPFLTIAAAKSAASSGDTIIVHPGTWVENNFLKKGVNLHFLVGAKVQYVETNLVSPAGWGLLDDRSLGATTNYVVFDDDVYWSAGTNAVYNTGLGGYQGNSNGLGAIVVSNANTLLTVRGKDCYASCYRSDGVYPAVIVVLNCQSNTSFSFDNLRDWQPSVTVPDAGNGNTPTPIDSASVGVFCTNGSFSLTLSGEILPKLGNEAFWLLSSGSSTVMNITLRANVLRGKLHGDCASTNISVRAIVAQVEPPDTGATASPPITWDGSGNFALDCQRLIARNNSQGMNFGGGAFANGSTLKAHVRADEIISEGANNWVVAQAGEVVLNVLRYRQKVGTVMQSGFQTDTGPGATLIVDGGEADTTAIGIMHTIGRATFKNVGICTTNFNSATNFPVFATTNGLSLQGCRLISPAACTNSIYSTNAQTVGLYWSAGNKTNNSNITLGPNAGWTVDANVR